MIKAMISVIAISSIALLIGCKDTVSTNPNWLFHWSISTDMISEGYHYTKTVSTKENSDIAFYFWYGSSKSALVNKSLNMLRLRYPKLTIEERPISLNESWVFAARFHMTMLTFKTIDINLRNELYELFATIDGSTKNKLNFKLYNLNINPKLFWDVFNSEDITVRLNKYNDLALDSGITAIPGLIVSNKYNFNAYSMDHAEDVFTAIEYLLKKDN